MISYINHFWHLVKRVYYLFLAQIYARIPFHALLLKRTKEAIRRHEIQNWFYALPHTRDYFSGVLKFVKEASVANQRQYWKILESGCGIGQNFVALHRMGFRQFTGIELDKRTFEAAKYFTARYGLNAKLYNKNGLHLKKLLPANSFHLYLALNWTYFVSDINPVFQSGWHILKPGGYMIVDIINKDFRPWFKRELITFNRYPYPKTPSEIRQCAETAGFRILKTEHKYLWRFNVYLQKPMMPAS